MACMVGAVFLVGCATGAGRQEAGTKAAILLSAAKLHTREMLINERERDSKWLARLMSESEDPAKVGFAPQIIRELEQIRIIAGALGLTFNPAAASAHRQADEVWTGQSSVDTQLPLCA